MTEETVQYTYNLAGHVQRMISRVGEGPFHSLRFEYDGRGMLWRVLADQWNDDGITWQAYRDSHGNSWEVGLTDAALDWDDAQALAESMGGDLAKIEDPTALAWFVDTYRPADDQETQYWLGGYQTHTLHSGQCPNPDETPWLCWWWEAPYAPGGPTLELFHWRPDDACEGGQWTQYSGCPTNGWLPGEPDDGGTVCQDNHQEDQMVLVLNEGDDPNTNGFADADSTDEYRALIMRPTCAGRDTETLPDYHRTWAMEFRYDGARQRYLTRKLDPDTLVAVGYGDDQWTTYLGDEPVDDYHYDSSQYTWPVDRQYLFGVAEWHADADTTGYLHGDLIGSTVAVTSDDASPAVVRRVVYTAFGEAISVAGPDGNPAAAPFATRYGYAGAFGYQEHDVGSCGVIGTNSLPPAEGCTQTAWAPDGLPDSLLKASPLAGFRFQHLGHRYYDPSTGRFIQRDPIGLAGGSSVYEYAMSRPVASIDPNGTEIIDGWIHDWEDRVKKKQPPQPELRKPLPPPEPVPPGTGLGLVCVPYWEGGLAGEYGTTGYLCVNLGGCDNHGLIGIDYFLFCGPPPFGFTMSCEQFDDLPELVP